MIENKCVKGKRTYTRQQKRLVFYVLMFALPILQFLFFYLYVNFNSISIAFQERKLLEEGSGYAISFTTKHFKEAFSFFFSGECGKMISNSSQLLACQLIIVTPLAVLFSYYIAKGRKGASFFRTMLYLPQVISLVVLGILFKYVVNEVYPYVAKEFFGKEDVIGLLITKGNTEETIFYTSLVFTLWFSFGANVLIYTGAMSGVDQSIVESAQLDGVTNLQEVWYIYVPMVFPTITTFILTGLAGIFNNQMNLYTFFGNDAEVQIFGYYFYKMTAKQLANSSGNALLASEAAFAELAQLAALGLIATLILVPTTLIVRKLLNKYGPSVD